MFIFYLWFCYAYVQSLKAFETRGILSTQACDVRERLKTNGTGFNKSIKEI